MTLKHPDTPTANRASPRSILGAIVVVGALAAIAYAVSSLLDGGQSGATQAAKVRVPEIRLVAPAQATGLHDASTSYFPAQFRLQVLEIEPLPSQF